MRRGKHGISFDEDFSMENNKSKNAQAQNARGRGRGRGRGAHSASSGRGRGRGGKSKIDIGFVFESEQKKEKPNNISKRKMKQTGNKVYSRQDRVIGEVVVKEWQRLPKQLVHEYCQKHKRPKPRFLQARTLQGQKGSSARIVLPDPKKKDKDINISTQEAFPTQREAEENCALLVLHHLGPTLPLERKLPEPYASTWLSLSSAEPAISYRSHFTSESERTQHSEEKKRKESQRKQKAEMRTRREERKYTKVFMKASRRKEIEEIVCAVAATKHSPEEVQALVEAMQEKEASNPKIKKVVTALVSSIKRIGFSEKDAAAGVRHVKAIRTLECKQSEFLSMDNAEFEQEVVDWLVLHTPEDRLPSQYNPKGTQLDVVVPSRESEPAGGRSSPEERQQSVVSHFKQLGFPANICNEVYQQVQGSSQHLNASVMKEHMIRPLHAEILPLLGVSCVGPESDPDVLEQELEALKAIYDDGVKVVKGDISTSVRVKQSCPVGSLCVEFVLFSDANYPFAVPYVFLMPASSFQSGHMTAFGSTISPYQRIALSQQLMKHLQTCIGEPMIFEACTHLQTHFDTLVLENMVRPASWSSELEAKVAQFREDVGQASDSRKSKEGRFRALRRNKKTDGALLEEYNALQTESKYQKMKAVRQSLPAANYASRLTDLINKHQVIVVSGETGCGKSTQIPQFILDDAIVSSAASTCNIICSQPRRISAVGLAERVSAERCDKLGGVVGYRIRLETKVSSRTRLTFVTSGILLRILSGNKTLEGVSHVVIDEVHERSTDIDFLLLILRQVLRRRKDLRVVLMSATVDAKMFASYFGGCPVVSMEGRTFPVKQLYAEDFLFELPSRSVEQYHPSRGRPLDDEELEEYRADLSSHTKAAKRLNYSQLGSLLRLEQAQARRGRLDTDLIAAVVLHIVQTTTSGGILIFLPGLAEINAVCDSVSHLLRGAHKSMDDFWIIPLHSSLSTSNQQKVFAKTPTGTRKIVASTNIAETSITVNDVVYVVDSGKMKETQYDPTRKMSMLVETWESQANAKQRAGRAGRVQPGVCYRMFTSKRFSSMPHHQDPEIKRTSLEHLCLQVKLLGLGTQKKANKSQSTLLHSVLGEAIAPPSSESITSAVNTLKSLKALHPNEAITPLGYFLARLPVGNVRLGKMLVYSAFFDCVSPVAKICALLSQQTPFNSPKEERDEAEAKRKQFCVSHSDHLTMLRALNEWEDRRKLGKGKAIEWAKENYLSWRALDTAEGLTRQLTSSLYDIGLLNRRNRGHDKDVNSDRTKLITSMLVAGLYPNIIRVQHPDEVFTKIFNGVVPKENDPKQVRFYLQDGSKVSIHPKSVNFSEGNFLCPWLIYLQIMQTTRVFVHDCSMATPYSLLMFGGDIDVDIKHGYITVDKWIKFKAVPRIAVLIRELRRELDFVLAMKIRSPSLDVQSSPVIQGILSLLQGDGF